MLWITGFGWPFGLKLIGLLQIRSCYVRFLIELKISGVNVISIDRQKLELSEHFEFILYLKR